MWMYFMIIKNPIFKLILVNFFYSWSTGYNGKLLLYTDQVTVAHVCGNCIRFLNTETNEEVFLDSPGDGIGAFASNPAYNTIALSEICIDAKIYIYELSTLEKPQVTLEGTILSFEILLVFPSQSNCIFAMLNQELAGRFYIL